MQYISEQFGGNVLGNQQRKIGGCFIDGLCECVSSLNWGVAWAKYGPPAKLNVL